MIIHDCLQRSERWEALRRGRPTASRFGDIITPAKGEYSKSAAGYIQELIAESFVTDVPANGFFGNAWTDRGSELESEALALFTATTGLRVVQVGFVTRDDNVVGCSPDGLIPQAIEGEDEDEALLRDPVYRAGVEAKCPKPAEHVATVMEGKVPAKHLPQVHGGMAVTGLSEWWFISYCPGLAPFIAKVVRDEYTEKVEAAVNRFVVEYAEARRAVIPRLKLNPAAAA